MPRTRTRTRQVAAAPHLTRWALAVQRACRHTLHPSPTYAFSLHALNTFCAPGTVPALKTGARSFPPWWSVRAPRTYSRTRRCRLKPAPAPSSISPSRTPFSLDTTRVDDTALLLTGWERPAVRLMMGRRRCAFGNVGRRVVGGGGRRLQRLLPLKASLVLAGPSCCVCGGSFVLQARILPAAPPRPWGSLLVRF